MRAALTLLRFSSLHAASAGLVVTFLLATLWLLASPWSEVQQRALLAGVGAAGATALGALPAFWLRSVSARNQAVMLSFGAGVMLAASAFSLILPGVAAAQGMLTHALLGSAWVGIGVALGAAGLLWADRLVPHLHTYAGPQGADAAHAQRIWLMVSAIALHNLPEGMAIGVGFAGGDVAAGSALAAAIALQDMPEGLVVALALRTAAVSPGRAALLGAATGLLEPAGALIGAQLAGAAALLYPLGMGIAAGAMIAVVSHEIIPETHRKGHERAATLGIIGGFIAMMLLDTALS